MVRFGTDGWRGTIADDFTLENARLVTQAICDYLPRLKAGPSPQPTLVIGYDTRFLAEKFAEEAALVATANGIRVFLAKSFTPTPAVSWSVVDKKTAGAILFTASHNPYFYQGLKFKEPCGGSASSEVTGQIEKAFRENLQRDKEPGILTKNEAQESGLLTYFDPKPDYLAYLKTLLEVETIKKKPVKVVVDPMYGAGQGYLSQALEELGCEAKEIHNFRDPLFGGTDPEPFGKHLQPLREAVVDGGFDIGLALDGDADRVGAIDASGDFINSHQIFALLLKYLVEHKGERGKVVKTVSTSQMINILAKRYNLPLIETPIGFKYICEQMISGDVLIGGEESGGIGVKGYIPERDGILVGLLLVEIMAAYGKTLSQLLGDLMDDIGYFYYGRMDVLIESSERRNILDGLAKLKPNQILGVAVVDINDMDGYKFCLKDGSWLMIRPSGTEAVVRIYVEAGSSDRVGGLVEEGRRILDTLRGKMSR